MKSTFLITLAAATLLLASCSNDETNNWNGEIRLSSKLDVLQSTRAATDIQSTQFAKDENIDVFINEHLSADETAISTYTQPLVYKAGDAGAMTPPSGSQPYFPTSGRNVDIQAYYPSGTVSSVSSTTGTVTFSVKDDQSSDADYKASDLMYGKPANNPVSKSSSAVSLTFTHLLSKITITLKAGTGTPSLDGAVVKFKDVKPSTTLTPSAGTISTASGDTKAITVMTAGSSNLSGSAIIVPQALPKGFIEVTLQNGAVLTSNFENMQDNNITFAASQEYKYEITVNLSSLTITSTITGWGNDASNNGSGTAEM